MKSAILQEADAEQFAEAGFAVLPGLYAPAELAALLRTVEQAPVSGPNFRRSQEVFAIRDMVGAVPALWPLLDTAALRQLLGQLFPTGCQLVKAIYFDKPAGSNWLVAWHQDLMINVSQRTDQPGFGPWTSKPEGVSVQPPVAVLENVVTLRLHLDDCDATNGALKVVPGSHRRGVVPAAAIAELTPEATVCAVPAGGVMLMKPLLLHASNRSTGNRPRRVMHLEFASVELPAGLAWREGKRLMM
ncbi:phytanoyl-CoA dioxygenase family protein [Hymenobacter properus]|uniref:Phytanoyl-CoA dioxygenase family protein n=1 Tax=Hymenobacter properus TaxID=2791026 RepID=A0A931BD32_9BACT|nr:phytanoyl-CoA dioxygenase family protein [Hymenobacter properus]MBF9140057.1 phytanoyl-CoA dioxygenase family protein [Hymenobacter properus]MBR7718864.1 phytanoyl-CoA dioxygenase family protein [Microvirga sp. SRT04]